MKAMEKDRTRRYETANALMLDIQRFLDDENVLAAPPSLAYRLSKLVRRNRSALAAASLVVGALVAGTLVSMWQANKARLSRDLANRNYEALKEEQRKTQEQQIETARARATAEDTLRFLIDSFDPGQPNGSTEKRSNVTLATLLDRAAINLESQFTEEPETKLRILDAIADANAALGRHQKAVPLRRQVIALAEATLSPADSMPFAAQIKLSDEIKRDSPREAEAIISALLPRAVSLLGADHKWTLECRIRLAILAEERFAKNGTDELKEKASRLVEEAYQACLEQKGEIHYLTLRCLDIRATLFRSLGELDKAQETFAQLLEARSKNQGEVPSLAFLEQLYFMADFYYDRRDFKRAEEIGRKALEGFEARYGAAHSRTVEMRRVLAWSVAELGGKDEAEKLFKQNLDLARSTDEDPIYIANSLVSLGSFFQNRSKPGDAIAVYREVVETLSNARGDDHHDTISALEHLVGAQIQFAYRIDGSYLEEATGLAMEAYTRRIKQWELDSVLPKPTQWQLGTILRYQGQFERSEKLLREALEIIGDTRLFERKQVLEQLVLTLMAQGDYETAAKFQWERYELGSGLTRIEVLGRRLAMLFAISPGHVSQIEVFDDLAENVTEDVYSLAHTAACFLLSPVDGHPAALANAKRMAERAFEKRKGHPWALYVAIAHILQDEPENALELLEPLYRQGGIENWWIPSSSLAYGAIAQHRLGNPDEATQLSRDAKRWRFEGEERKRKSEHPNYNEPFLDGQLLVEVALQEMRKVLGNPP